MNKVNWREGRVTESLLRNGRVQTTGIEAKVYSSAVDLVAVNSRGNLTTGSLSIPNDSETLKNIALLFSTLAAEAAAKEDEENGVYPTRADYVAAAGAGEEGYEQLIPDNALVNEGDDGAYVQCWKWIPSVSAKGTPSQKAWVAATNDGCCAYCQSIKTVDYDSRDNGVQHARCECGAEWVEHSDPLDDNETPTVISVDVISLQSAEVAA